MQVKNSPAPLKTSDAGIFAVQRGVFLQKQIHRGGGQEQDRAEFSGLMLDNL